MATLQDQLADLRRRIEALPADARAAEIMPLEAEARTLLTATKNTPYEETAKALFAELARRSAPPAPEVASQRAALRRARIRMEMAAGDEDYDEAIDILAKVLEQDAHNSDALALLQQAAAHGPQHAMKVRDLLSRYGLSLPSTPAQPAKPPAEPLPEPIPATPDEDTEVPPSKAQAASSPRPNNNVDALMAELTQAYYAGDYQRTIELANRVLAVQPENAAALDYRQKSEDSLIRGIVPDHRIPFDARVAFNRAKSLARAGIYEEAGKLYREARDIAERAGIANWKDAEQALLEIQELALARELLAEGDRLLANDEWQAALRKYEGAQRVVPNDPIAQERIDLVKRVQEQYDKAAVQLNMMSGSLTDRVNNLQHLLQTLATLRQILPGSARLQRMADEATARLQTLKAQLADQGRAALARLEASTVLDERMRLVTEAVRALETAHAIDPSDSELNALLQSARQLETQISEARQVIERASALIAQNFDAELSQARSMLAALRNHTQDPRYRNVVSELLARHVERIEASLDRGDAQSAERWLSLAKEEPFRILGRRSELLQLEEEVRKLKRGGAMRTAAFGGAALIVVIFLAFLTRGAWLPLFTPTDTPTPTFTPTFTLTPSDTPTPTPTFTPTFTLTPSDTPTPTLTFTPTFTHTWTWTPSLTFTPSFTPTASLTPTHTNTPTHTFTPTDTPTITNTPTDTLTPTITLTPSITFTPSHTPTPLIRCIVITTQQVIVRSRPTLAGTPISTAVVNQQMNVLEIRSVDGFAWYRVEYQVDGIPVMGWVQASRTREFGPPCSQ